MSEFTEDDAAGYGEVDNSFIKQSDKNSTDRGIKDFQIMSPEFGIPVGTMRIPVSWKESYNTEEGLLLEGPDGIKIYKARYTSHFYSNDPQRNQISMQNGESVQPVQPIDGVVNNVLKPLGQAQGLRLVQRSPLPQLAQFDTRFDSYLFQATPAQKQNQCLVTEWEDGQGNPSMVIIRYFITQYQIGGTGWGYTLNAMEAFEGLGDACKTLLTKFYFEKKSMKEIAHELQLDAASTRNKKYRCMQTLRELALEMNEK